MAYELLPPDGSEYLDNQNVQRFLNAIAMAEGTAKPGVDPYRVAFGGSTFDDLSAHPNVRREFTQTDGKKNYTTAAGKYQFLKGTWSDVADKLALPDFSPRSQDLGAIELLRRNGALDDVLAGKFDSAVKKSGRTWASLPSSPYAQPRRSAGFLERALNSVIPSAQAEERPMAGKWEMLPPETSGGQSAGQWEMLPTGADGASEASPARQPMSRAERFGAGLADPIHGGAQLLTNLLPGGVVRAGNQLNNWLADNTGLVAHLPEGGVDQQVRERERDYQARRGDTGLDGWRLAGNVLSPTNAALGLRGAQAIGTGSKVLGGALTGAASASTAPVTNGSFGTEKAKQVATGAAFGGAVPALIGGVSRVISPNASTNQQLALLRNAGVRPTIGQALGGRMNALEEKAASVPIVGDMISKARGNALEDFNRAAINRATSRLGVSVDDIGNAGVARAQQAVSQAYDDALGRLKHVRLDGQFRQDFGQLQQMTRSLTPQMRSKFDRTVKDVLDGRASTSGTMTAETFKRVDSELGQIAKNYSGSSVASEKEFGDAVLQLKDLLKQQAMRTNPKAAQAIREADSAFAQLARIENAANRAVNADGVFTPGQLNMAVRQADTSARRRATAGGRALMQDLSGAGQSVLGNRVPNSFTSDRALIAAGTLGGAGLLSPATAAGLLGGAALYTGPAQRALTGLVTARPQMAQPIARSLLQSAPGFSPLGAQVGLQLGQR